MADKSRNAKQTHSILTFLNNSPTAAHATSEMVKCVHQKGYKELSEKNSWTLNSGEGFYIVREDEGFVAGIMGEKPDTIQKWNIAAAHTDSPGFRIKPQPVINRNGMVLLSAEIYGGPLLASWADRDLSLAGRILVRDGEKGFNTLLWKCNKPVLRIPQPAVHLNRQVNEEGLTFNKQTQLVPLFKLAEGNNVFTQKDFIEWVASENNIKEEDIIDMSLEIFDLQPAVFGGADNEFLLSGRIDNLAMCYSAVEALPVSGTIPKHPALVICFNHEEIGSRTPTGGDSMFLGSVLERLAIATGLNREEYLRSLSSSVLFSADGVHAYHPNYPELYETNHPVHMNGGPAIKINAQKRYATDLYTSALFKELAQQAGIPVQTYVHRADLPCGSTIGPLVSANLGLRTLDAGVPMLAMHSVREMSGTSDINAMIHLLKTFLLNDM